MCSIEVRTIHPPPQKKGCQLVFIEILLFKLLSESVLMSLQIHEKEEKELCVRRSSSLQMTHRPAFEVPLMLSSDVGRMHVYEGGGGGEDPVMSVTTVTSRMQ